MRIGLVICGILLVTGAGRAEDEIKLFNGKDLSGWSGNEDLWRVEDGCIVGSTDGHKIPGNTFLIYEKEFNDFELRFKVSLRNHNSGVQFRSKTVDKTRFVMSGYQADCASGYWGLLYEERGRGILQKPAKENIAKEKEWVQFVVRAKGPEITISVNGERTVEYVEKDPKRGATRGQIGLQLHAGPEMTVRFKDIILMPL
jgi:hypothetical protein